MARYGLASRPVMATPIRVGRPEDRHPGVDSQGKRKGGKNTMTLSQLVIQQKAALSSHRAMPDRRNMRKVEVS
jgi:hypothetical protein